MLLFLFISFTRIYAQKAEAITGVWLTEDKKGKVEIYNSGGKYFGKIVWGKDASTKKDVNNPDPKLRNRTLLNLVILSDFTFDKDEWNGGKIYDPETGKTYSCTMKLQNGKLAIRGYIGISAFGRTTTWTRA
ncbi:DUF2147 domain-containing protein [Rubrolithibacter danxiaensis]|uniref:DUF2147 domain-containing protein n=1 Tax=Rubrolithibacter danxiaensis TaxID=3390805 RepID=UPI003BF8CA9B